MLPARSDLALQRRVDSTNARWLSELIDERVNTGAPVTFGQCWWSILDLAHGADADTALQVRVLALAESALAARESPDGRLVLFADYIVRLSDRIDVARGERQRYGTQFERVPQAIILKPLAHPDSVDAWRSSLGLLPLAAYLETHPRPTPWFGDSVRPDPHALTDEQRAAIALATTDLAKVPWSADDIELRYSHSMWRPIGPTSGQLILRRRKGQWSAVQVWPRPFERVPTQLLDSAGWPQRPIPLLEAVRLADPGALWSTLVRHGLLELADSLPRNEAEIILHPSAHIVEVRTAKGYRKSTYINAARFRTPADLRMLRLARLIEGAMKPEER